MRRSVAIRLSMLSIVSIVMFANTGTADGSTSIGGNRLWYQNLSQISGGAYHTAAIKADGTLWTWGSNYEGQLGIGEEAGPDPWSAPKRLSPVQVGADRNWKAVFTRATSTFALKADGSLWAWGGNGNGQLGIGTTSAVSSPVQVGSEREWASIAAAEIYTVALKSNGTLWAWGDNFYGQLGDGTNTPHSTPIQIGGDTNWSVIAVGGETTIALKSDGSLWAWGRNDFYQHGDGTTTNKNQPTRIGTDTDWKAIAQAGASGIGLKANGTIWGWGFNDLGTVGNGTTTIQPTPVQIGSDRDWIGIDAKGGHCTALKADGSLWVWGAFFSQSAQWYEIISLSPVRVGTEKNWIAVSGGPDHILTMRANGTMWSFGYNEFGQLGDGTVEDRTSLVFIMAEVKRVRVETALFSTYVLKTDGTIWGSGDCLSGYCGDGYRGSRYTPIRIGQDSDWVAFSAYGAYGIAIKADGSLWGWGRNGYGELGDGSNTGHPYPVRIGSDSDWLIVVAGAYTSTAIKADGSLWGWGHNAWGTVGDGTYINRNSPVRIGSDSDWVHVSGFNTHKMAIKANGTLWGWGFNNYGQLGDGTTNNRNSPYQITWPYIVWGSVSAGGAHTIANWGNGVLWGWGANSSGELGDGSNTIRWSPIRIGTGFYRVVAGANRTMAINGNGSLWGWGSLPLGNGTLSPSPNLVRLGSDSNWLDVSPEGDQHTMALKADGSLWGWGSTYFGQLGLGTQNDSTWRLSPVNVSSYWDFNTAPAFSPPGASRNTVASPVDESTGLNPVLLEFKVTSPGTTTLSSSNTADSAPTGFQLGDPPIYYEISTTAGYSGQIKVCISFAGVQYSNASTLKLLHYETGTWVDITASGYPDMGSKIICGFTTSLSPFTVVGSMIGNISGPVAPVAVGSSVSLSAPVSPDPTFTDPRASWDWGDGTVSLNVPLTNENSLAAGTHTYSAPGVYVVTLYLKNGTETISSETYRYVVVYDPAAGFVTGGGWFTSPAGAYAPDLTLEGKASFGFVAKYLKGANTPTGKTEFQFQVANLNFNSQSYDWLVVAGARAQFKGTGAINGSGNYEFLLTAVDGQVSGGGGADKFRIKIWDKSTGQVVYDNQMGASDNTDPATEIGGGSIVIHK